MTETAADEAAPPRTVADVFHVKHRHRIPRPERRAGVVYTAADLLDVLGVASAPVHRSLNRWLGLAPGTGATANGTRKWITEREAIGLVAGFRSDLEHDTAGRVAFAVASTRRRYVLVNEAGWVELETEWGAAQMAEWLAAFGPFSIIDTATVAESLPPRRDP